MDKFLFQKFLDKYFAENSILKDKIFYKLTLFEKYLDCIVKWNKSINITGFNKKKFIFNGIIEPLIILNVFSDFSSPIVDIGTGAGIPSISFAIFFDKLKVYAIEINKKKIAFLNFVKFNLQLENLSILEKPPENSHIISSRAFMNYENFLEFLKKKNLKTNYILLYFKDKIPSDNFYKSIKYKTEFSKSIYFQMVKKFL